ncbi:MAG: arsenate reductase [Flavobacterium sp.]|jgi:arsenate reductase
MITIYHNNKCQKSREGLAYLKSLSNEIEVNEYMNSELTEQKIKELLKKLNYKPIELVRTNEKIWKENFKNSNLSEEEIIQKMIAFPQLIQRPLIVYQNKAIVARPTEKIKDLF